MVGVADADEHQHGPQPVAAYLLAQERLEHVFLHGVTDGGKGLRGVVRGHHAADDAEGDHYDGLGGS